MYISSVILTNFRNFRFAKLKFQKGFNTIIGENGSGKTNIIQAVRILLDESLPRTYKFYESDFNRSVGDWRGHWIILQIFFDELDYGDEAQALAVHQVGDAAPDATKGSCSVMFRPKYAFRQGLFDLSIDASTRHKAWKVRHAFRSR